MAFQGMAVKVDGDGISRFDSQMLGKDDGPADLDVCTVNRNGITQLGLGGNYGLRPRHWGEG